MKTEMKFEELGLCDSTLAALKKKKFEVASEIQAKVIPVVLNSQSDILGIAQTGTGKTAAFGLPLIEKIDVGNNLPKAIILAPTRELAIQVSDEINTYLGSKKLIVFPVYGGTAITNHIKDIKRGVDIIVGTPGRVLDLVKRKALKLEEIDYFVLDEADEMLNMGFIEDIETILASASKNKRVMLFSATMPDRIAKLSKKYMKDQVVVEIEKKKFNSDLIKQVYYKLRYSEKFDALCKIIDVEPFFYGIVFCKTRMDVDEVTAYLKKAKYEADSIHGDIAQAKREKILTKFRDQKLHILVATDVAARGIDVSNLTHVINFSIPQELETYVHRVGRTGRAGNSGTAITFIGPKELHIVKRLEKITNNSKIELGTLPTMKDLASSNNERIVKEVEGIMATGGHKLYSEMTHSLIKKYGPEGAVSALLHKIFHKEIENPAHTTRERSSDRDGGRGSKDRNSRGREDRWSKGSKSDSRNDRFSPRGGRDDRSSRGGREERPRGDRRDDKRRIDSSGNSDSTRLFIAKGTHDKMNRRNLVLYLEKMSGAKNIRGNDVKVCGAFSFATLSKDDAKKVLKGFENQTADNGRPIVEIAQ